MMTELASILAIASVASYDDTPSDEHLETVVTGRLLAMMKNLAAKHLSDSPTPRDRQRLIIDVLETATAIAKGELEL